MTKTKAHLVTGLAAVTSALLGGCDPTFFAEAENRAAIEAFSVPAKVAGDYGAQLVALSDDDSSRFYASSPTYTSYGEYDGWLEDSLALSFISVGCLRSGEQCSPAASKSVNGIAGAAAFGDETTCIAKPNFTAVNDSTKTVLNVACASEEASFNVEVLKDVVGETFGAAITALPHAKGFVVSEPEVGALFATFRESSMAAPLVALDLDGYTPGDDFGTVLASIQVNEVSLVAASDGTKVVVFEVEDNDVDTFKTSLVGCVNADQTVTSIAFADIDGDDVPEVFTGGSTGVVGATAAQVSAGDCSGDGAAGVALACSDLSDDDEDVTGACGGGLGASVAFGDVDGNGSVELLVGTPGSEAEGKSEAGAVFVVPVDVVDGAVDFQADEAEAAYDSEPSKGAHLGFSVAAMRSFPSSGARDEVIAGAPGASSVFVFLCTGFADDTPGGDLDDRCQ